MLSHKKTLIPFYVDDYGLVPIAFLLDVIVHLVLIFHSTVNMCGHPPTNHKDTDTAII